MHALHLGGLPPKGGSVCSLTAGGLRQVPLGFTASGTPRFLSPGDGVSLNPRNDYASLGRTIFLSEINKSFYPGKLDLLGRLRT